MTRGRAVERGACFCHFGQQRRHVGARGRVLRAGHYWVPHWYKAAHHVAIWDKFSGPAIKPKYARGILDTWWYDPAKAAKLGN